MRAFQNVPEIPHFYNITRFSASFHYNVRHPLQPRRAHRLRKSPAHQVRTLHRGRPLARSCSCESALYLAQRKAPDGRRSLTCSLGSLCQCGGASEAAIAGETRAPGCRIRCAVCLVSAANRRSAAGRPASRPSLFVAPGCLWATPSLGMGNQCPVAGNKDDDMGRAPSARALTLVTESGTISGGLPVTDPVRVPKRAGD